MNVLKNLQTRTVIACIALFLFFVQLVPLSYLDDTEFAEYKREHDPFARQVDVPPEHLANYLIGNLFGGLKQIAINSLWVKYGRLKDDDRHEEAIALLKVLRVLQPRRERVWSHLGWDIAFNMSNKQPGREEEWNMVKQGIEVLKDGIQRMPDSYVLRLDTAWVYNYRVPQSAYMMDQVWKGSAEDPANRKTNYRIGLDYLWEGRKLAKQQEELDRYRGRYGFIVTYSFYDVIMLMHYGQHDRAKDRIPKVKKIFKKLQRDYRGRGRMPRTYQVRYRSYDVLPELIELDRKLTEVPWNTAEQRKRNRDEKIRRTTTYLKEWRKFFHTYHYALAEEAARHVLHQSFEPLYYVSRDLEQYYRTGTDQHRQRALNLFQQLQPLVNSLPPEQGNPGGGYLSSAEDDMGLFWDTMNDYYKHLRNLQTAEDNRERESAKRNLEQVYTDLVKLYHRSHRGFRQPWVQRHIDRLEQTLNVQ